VGPSRRSTPSKGLAENEVHDERDFAVVFHDIGDGHHVGVQNACGETGFVEETRCEDRIAGEVRVQLLDRHDACESPLASPGTVVKALPHTSFAPAATRKAIRRVAERAWRAGAPKELTVGRRGLRGRAGRRWLRRCVVCVPLVRRIATPVAGEQGGG
jgi:hypothetical protein